MPGHDQPAEVLPAPLGHTLTRTVWKGGVEVRDGHLVIRGRTVPAGELDTAEEHGRAVLAAEQRAETEQVDRAVRAAVAWIRKHQPAAVATT